jgi:putative Mg2+ transporter-C (MgtC) family protein
MWDMLRAEFSSTAPLPLAIVLLRMAGALLLAGAIGLERELKKDTAGLRTNMLVGLAAASFALVTLQVVPAFEGQGDAVQMDPLRLVEATTAGVAFLAAGLIVYARGEVRGLTTGASMWLAAAIGLSAGLGYWSIALPAAVLGLVVLTVLRRIEQKLGLKEH